MKASPSSPPTMCTPPSGIPSPLKNSRMSRALADHGRFCKRMMTLMMLVAGCVAEGERERGKIIDGDERDIVCGCEGERNIVCLFVVGRERGI